MCKNYNEKIKILIFETGLNQSQVANELGMSKQYFNKIVNNQIVPSLDKIIAIFDYFEDKLKDKNKILSSNWYLTGKGPMFLSAESDNDPNVVNIKLKKGQILKVEYEE